MYYNDDFRSSDQYRYTNRDQLPHDDYAPGPNRAPAPAPEFPKKQGFFHRTAVKVTALILACSTNALPMSIWILKGFFDTVSKSLEEAAYIDGASRGYSMVRIIVPLVQPGILAVGL